MECIKHCTQITEGIAISSALQDDLWWFQHCGLQMKVLFSRPNCNLGLQVYHLSLEPCGLVLGLLLVFHSWHDEFKSHHLQNVRNYLLCYSTYSLQKLQCIIYYSFMWLFFAIHSSYCQPLSWS